MQVSELRDGLADFNQAAPVMVAIPTMTGPHELRALHVAGHIDHPGEVKTDHTIHALDIVCDSWDDPQEASGAIDTIGALAEAIAPYPDQMHVRIAVPMSHESVSHRMLDIVMIGRSVGAGKEIQLVCESWDNPMQVIKPKGG